MSFTNEERQVLLITPRVGPGVIARLEAAGFDSFAKICERGVDEVVNAICTSVGSNAWRNRHGAIVEALARGGRA